MDTPITRRMTALYIVALVIIGILLVTEHTLVQSNLSAQAHDAHVINIAGRQRMLSQKLCKAALAIRFAVDPGSRQMRIDEVRQVASLWERSHRGLKNGDAELDLPGSNSDSVRVMFSDIEGPHQIMLDNARSLAEAASNRSAPDPGWSPYIQRILQEENVFLTGMDRLVSQYDLEAKQRVVHLQRMEMGLLGASLGVLALLVIFIFRPAVNLVRHALLAQQEAEASVLRQNALLERRNAELEEQKSEMMDQQMRFREVEARLERAQTQLSQASSHLALATRRLDTSPVLR
ncbi:MAG: type IV pili methyl-accepting chemotaxis transducer N-terminal domain-containing protein [Capsulimonas sp.]|uniref:type IV pili methyl-accepting chemotaxis transducer N-terminal domain-containing protein n=1 Tax=Capsulimonas sp. TaxID=2494211 RepID=UPI0032630F4F